MRKLLSGLILSLVATAASAEWVFVAESSVGNKFYADPTTKKRTGNVVRIWELIDYEQPEVVSGKVANSERAYLQNDCAESTRQKLQTTVFAGNMAAGESIRSSAEPANKRFVAPNSAAEALLNFACQ